MIDERYSLIFRFQFNSFLFFVLKKGNTGRVETSGYIVGT